MTVLELVSFTTVDFTLEAKPNLSASKVSSLEPIRAGDAHHADNSIMTDRHVQSVASREAVLKRSRSPESEGFEIAGWNQPADQTGGDRTTGQVLPNRKVVAAWGLGLPRWRQLL